MRHHLLVAAGGTGGHMFPAQALAEEMVSRGWRVTLATDARGARFADRFPRGVRVRTLPSASFARGGGLRRLVVPFVLGGGVVMSLGRMLRDRPAVVAGFGGYPSIPSLAAAWLLRCPRLVHEQNGVLGRVNRLFARHVEAVACGTWPTAVPRGARKEDIGNPVREAVLAHAGAPYRPPGGDGPLNIVVIGGSQGARVMTDVVPPALGQLPADIVARLFVTHQARPEDADRARAAYADAGIRAEIAPFFTDIPDRLADAQLVISRAGASSIADLAVIGRPAILVPYPAAAADHQTVNARALADRGGACLIAEDRLDAATLCHQIGAILARPDRAREMAARALAAGRPDAARRLAQLVERIAGD